VRIALVHDWLTAMRGGEKCLEVLCRRFPQARLFTLVHARGTTAPAIERMPITTSLLQRLPGAATHYRWLLPLMPAAVERLEIPGDVDLVVSLSHAVAKGIRPPAGVPHVCYCFTPMRYAWDRRADYFGGVPACGSGRLCRTPLAAFRNLVLDRIQHWDRQSADRVTHFVAISRTVADRIAACYGRTSRVIYPPVDTDFYTPADVQREDFFLCVSALVPYKRIDLAIAACNRHSRRLVIIGEGPERRRLQRLAGPTVTLAGWRSNEGIRDHMRRARAVLFPGHEDFGIVPVEAQACGTPVVAYGRGGATETIIPADESTAGTGWFFSAQTPESLYQAMELCESHPERFDPKLARRQAERFAADRFERELLGYLMGGEWRLPQAGAVSDRGPATGRLTAHRSLDRMRIVAAARG
jgi:glycosyltransferase involved in cell wall biosynthesis